MSTSEICLAAVVVMLFVAGISLLGVALLQGRKARKQWDWQPRS